MRILVVEDVLLQRIAIVGALEEAGYEVVEASTADAALQKLENGLSVHAVVTDVQMPGSLDGVHFAAIARERWPGIGIVVVSGQVQPATDELPAAARFLAKPVSVPLLLKTLHEVALREV